MPNVSDTSAQVYKINNLAIVIITFLTSVNIQLIDFYYPIVFKNTPFVTYVDNNSNNSVQTAWNIEWSNNDYVRLGNINSGTILIIGYI